MLKTVTNIIDASQIKTPISLDGNVTLSTGNLVIGTAGKGIDFSADPSAAGMTSELLDDYEKGTWTPTILGDSGTGVTYITQTGRYVKIGKVVYVEFYIALSSKGTISGEAAMGDLPFTVVNAGVSARATLSVSIWESLATAKSWVALYTFTNSQKAYFVASAGAVASSENAMNTSAISNTSVFIGSGVYEAA